MLASGGAGWQAEHRMLDDLDRMLLDIEGSWWTMGDRKAEVVHRIFGWSLAAYGRRLRQAAAKPEAREYAPLVVARLKRAARERLRQRVGPVGREGSPRR
jgi:hypothetical protein